MPAFRARGPMFRGQKIAVGRYLYPAATEVTPHARWEK